ncbi:hypothetical protein CTI12_AA041700 [Artemisia annua]|uniref:Wound-induced protein 1 n=1 Tax=Artemisia annua TaxID=35608 RepID=A0A2U1QE41_ARTAN|nr:hypothetical protein CTI12_AA041700 [Artemisia annua]
MVLLSVALFTHDFKAHFNEKSEILQGITAYQQQHTQSCQKKLVRCRQSLLYPKRLLKTNVLKTGFLIDPAEPPCQSSTGVSTEIFVQNHFPITRSVHDLTDSTDRITKKHLQNHPLNNQTLSILANPHPVLEDTTEPIKSVVLDLYHALSIRDVTTVHKLLAPDLEWWFHGPPSHQFMMRLLTGSEQQPNDSFVFVPLSVDVFGNTVIVEGCDWEKDIAWIHAWTVGACGVITQVREYFNTSLTVTRFGDSKTKIKALHCPSVWESSLSGRVGKSVPGLVLAI